MAAGSGKNVATFTGFVLLNTFLAIFIVSLGQSPGGGDVARMAARYVEDTSFDT